MTNDIPSSLWHQYQPYVEIDNENPYTIQKPNFQYGHCSNQGSELLSQVSETDHFYAEADHQKDCYFYSQQMNAFSASHVIATDSNFAMYYDNHTSFKKFHNLPSSHTYDRNTGNPFISILVYICFVINSYRLE